MMTWLNSGLTHEGWTPALAVLGDCAVKGLLLLALAALVAGAMRRCSAAARHLLWALALGGLLLLPALSTLLPKWQVPLLPGAEQPPARSAPVMERNDGARPAGGRMDAAAPGPRTQVAPPPAVAARMAAAPLPPATADRAALRRGTSWLLAAWLGVALALMAPLGAGLAVVGRRVRQARPPEGREVPELAAALAESLGLGRGVRILCAGAGAMPMATGLLRPAILLPQEAATWTGEQLRAVLLHELAHVKRRDCLTHALARLAVALHWFNPLAWAALHRLRIERELACDDLVLAAGERASTYSHTLLEMARTMRAGALTSATAVTMARRGQLEGRLLAILDAGRNRRLVTRRRLLWGEAVLLGLTAALAALQVGSPAQQDVNEAIKILSRTSMFDSNSTAQIQKVLGLVRRHPEQETLPLLADWLSSRSNTRRRSAIYMIGELTWQDPAPVRQPLLRLLDHSEDITRGMAALTASYLQEGAAYDRTLKMLREDDSAYARRCAAFALGELNDPRALPALEDAAAAGESQVQENARDAVERLKWRKEFADETGDRAKAALGVWMLAGSTANQELRIGRAMDLIRAADPASRTAVLRKALAFDGPQCWFFKGASLLASQRLAKAAGAQNAPPPAAAFTAQLPGGGSVQLLGLTEKFWQDPATWWYPDGTRGGAVPDELKNPPGNPVIEAGANELTIAIALRIEEGQTKPADWCFELTAGRGVRYVQTDYKKVATNGWMRRQPLGLIAASLPSECTTCALRLGVAQGPWKTVAIYVNDKKALTQCSEPSLQIKLIKFSDNWRNTIVQYDHRIQDQAFQVVAIHKDGRPLDINGFGGGLNDSPFPFVRFTAKPEEIARFEFQTRPYQWVQANNLSLVPDMKTAVQIAVEKGTAATRRAAPEATPTPAELFQ